MEVKLVVLSLFIITCAAQRSPYAGGGYGYPVVTTTQAPLDNRFGEGTTTTTMRIPIEALGDAELVTYLLSLPAEQRPFWILNWQAMQNNRDHPQTYPQRENGYLDWYY